MSEKKPAHAGFFPSESRKISRSFAIFRTLKTPARGFSSTHIPPPRRRFRRRMRAAIHRAMSRVVVRMRCGPLFSRLPAYRRKMRAAWRARDAARARPLPETPFSGRHFFFTKVLTSQKHLI